jgi:aryl-alcohol dehydrogenase-like predicted oxidoreductase
LALGRKDLTPYCVENNISIVAYSPLAQGLLTGKLKQDINSTQDNRAKNNTFKERITIALSQL